MKSPSRKIDSHKGENGKVLVVGGNEIFFGAPIFAARGVEESGADLILLYVPPEHKEAAKNAGRNFILYSFSDSHLTLDDYDLIHELESSVDVLLIGNGIGKDPESYEALLRILNTSEIPVVIDADGLIPEILSAHRRSPWIITPHEGEFQRIFSLPGTKENVHAMAGKYGMTILRKGPVDIISDGSAVTENTSGVPEMTVGGTGDALAGITAGFMARGLSPLESCELSAFILGKCGEELSESRASFTTEDLLAIFPFVAKRFMSRP